ncbi:O-antigen ligase family protein [Bradyrhizobium sp. LLZ17]|uniref:O-antigen ligase family protein n=1 Tax=Bradyrhizobium sp. LLZ17 TaxID=3239388 RepID=A0AB39XI35_9BRAD
MSASLTHNGRAPYHLTLPRSVAQAGTFFFLLFVFMWPFQRAPFLADNLFGIQGFKPFNLLSAVVLAYLLFDTALLHATDKIEQTSIRIFFLYFATLAIALIRSIPNAPLLHSRGPESFPEPYVDYVLSCCIVPTFYILSFLFILKRMCSFRELEKITTVICLSILLLSIAFVALVLTNPSVLLSGHANGIADSDRDEMAQLCIVYFGAHYNVIGSLFICTVPLLLYRALARGGLWIAPLCLSLLAVLLLESRTALLTVAASCSLFLILRRSFVILVLGAAAAGLTSLIWIGPTVQALLSIGFDSSSGVSADALFTGRVDSIWAPLLEEWTSDTRLFLFGAGRYGIQTSQLWDSGAMIRVGHAHNAIINFFLDCGVILTGVLLVFLCVGAATAWRVGRRLNSDLYWALFASMVGCGISMATGRDILPTIENMYVFPIIAMMINVARLRYRNAYSHSVQSDKIVRRDASKA